MHSKLNDHLPKHADVTRLFGANHKEWYKGSYPYSKPFDFIPKMVWFPKLYRHSVWTNQLTEDGSKIIEKKSSGEEIGGERSEEVNKIVFGHYKDPVGKTTYRYMEIHFNLLDLLTSKMCINLYLKVRASNRS